MSISPRNAARLARALCVAACATPLFAHAQTLPLPLKPNPAYARLPAYTGTLGKRPIVLRLGPKGGEDREGVHGEYQYTDTGEVTLVAGDRDGNTLEVEESNDGTHIVGNWVGRFAADGSVSGDRMNVDDSDPQPFDLKPVAAGAEASGVSGVPVTTQPAPVGAEAPQTAAPAAAAPTAPAVPAAPTKGGQPVHGVSNLTTGD